MSYRDNWKFIYPISELLAAAGLKESFHSGRLIFWQEKNDEVMEKIKAEGLEISESVASGYSNSGRNAQVLVRVDLQTDLSECQNKINEHRQKTKDYLAWVQVFNSQPQTNTFELSKDDWLYFFGK